MHGNVLQDKEWSGLNSQQCVVEKPWCLVPWLSGVWIWGMGDGTYKERPISNYKSQSKGLGLGGILAFTQPHGFQTGYWSSNWIQKFKLEPKLPVLNQLRVCVLSHFSRVRLHDPMDCSPPGSSVHGILQARILEWVAMPSSGGFISPSKLIGILIPYISLGAWLKWHWSR